MFEYSGDWLVSSIQKQPLLELDEEIAVTKAVRELRGEDTQE